MDLVFSNSLRIQSGDIPMRSCLPEKEKQKKKKTATALGLWMPLKNVVHLSVSFLRVPFLVGFTGK